MINQSNNRIIKIEITTREGNEIVTRTLEGDQATEWYRMTEEVKILAESRNMNPDWSKLKWKERRQPN